MTVAKNHDAYAEGETPSWAWPVHAFVAWLATILGYIASFKRARRFKADWRDSWEGLRHSEWLRDQLIAQGVAQLLAGEPLHLDDTKIQLTPPATFGGPCPRTPFDMNRRFLALARWAANPEAIIRERYRRLSRHPLAAHALTDAALRAPAQHDLVGVSRFPVALMLSSARSARPSKHERGLTTARGPPRPYSPPPFPTASARSASENARLCPFPTPDEPCDTPQHESLYPAHRNRRAAADRECGYGPDHPEAVPEDGVARGAGEGAVL